MTSKDLLKLWVDEFLNDTGHAGCGLCADGGVIDTHRLNMRNTHKHPCGVRAFCICPVGRKLKEQGIKLDRSAEVS